MHQPMTTPISQDNGEVGELPTQRRPCSFCGSTSGDIQTGFRAMICSGCIADMRKLLLELNTAQDAAPLHHSIAGSECVFCGRILATAGFSLRRWIFGVCGECACSITKTDISYVGQPAQSFEF
jgi:hypothetical protein